MCTYNRFEYIKYTIDSILDQLVDKKNVFEFVICDSGSTDGTLEYLNSLENVRVLNIGFIGVAQSYIYAFKNAKGKYIININDHMYINMDNVLKCLSDINNDSKIGCVMYSMSAYGFGVYNRKPFEWPTFRYRVEGLLLHHLFIFRKQDVEQFDHNYVRNEWDFDFIIKLLTQGKSIGLYRYVFGCELKLDDNYGSVQCKQRYHAVNNENDTKYFKDKYASFIDLIYRKQNSTLFLVINRAVLRIINYYLNRIVTMNHFSLPLKKESNYTINKIPTREDMSDSLKDLRIDNYSKTVSILMYKFINKVLYNSVNVGVIEKSNTRNFYLIQCLSEDALKKIYKL